MELINADKCKKISDHLPNQFHLRANKKYMTTKYLHSELTDKIINCFYTVYNTLGYGFLEKVYENSLCILLREAGLKVNAQLPINVYFRNNLVGEYYADIIVEDKVIIELKAVESLKDIHGNQLVNYLKATEIEIGLLLNFGVKPEV